MAKKSEEAQALPDALFECCNAAVFRRIENVSMDGQTRAVAYECRRCAMVWMFRDGAWVRVVE